MSTAKKWTIISRDPLFKEGWLSRETFSLVHLPVSQKLVPTPWLLVSVCLVCALFNIRQPELTQLVRMSCLSHTGPETHTHTHTSVMGGPSYFSQTQSDVPDGTKMTESIQMRSSIVENMKMIGCCVQSATASYSQLNPQMKYTEETTVN